MPRQNLMSLPLKNSGTMSIAVVEQLPDSILHTLICETYVGDFP
jgi:hypothetical protein